MKLFFAIILLIDLSCGSKKQCFTEKIKNSKCVYIKNGNIVPGQYFIYSESEYKEFANDKLYAISKISWHSCDSYTLVVNKVFDNKSLFKEGDTLNVKIMSVEKDTFTCIASAFNYSSELKLLRVIN